MFDKQRGALLGLAVGDALGAPIEFKPPGSFQPVTDYRAGGPFNLKAGEWTDDTSMALALADSLANAGWDLDDQARRYLRWYRDGHYSVTGACFDIGNTTRDALERFEQTGQVWTAIDRSESGSGNGCLMRLAPVPIRYAHLFPAKTAQLARLAGESSLTTHGSPICVSACSFMALILTGLLHGHDRSEVLSPTWAPLEELRAAALLDSRIEEIAQGSYRHKRPPQIRGGGYVVHALEAALWAFYDAPDFSTAVLRAVNLGDDSDTTGAICGQLAGAYWGESAIPEQWRSELARRDLLELAIGGLLGS